MIALTELWGLVGRHSASKRQGYLICPEVWVDPIDRPSNVRQCACGAQVWVSAGTSTALVESGQLEPRCPSCWEESGAGLTLHPDTEAELRRAGMRTLERAWKRIETEREAAQASSVDTEPSGPPGTATGP